MGCIGQGPLLAHDRPLNSRHVLGAYDVPGATLRPSLCYVIKLEHNYLKIRQSWNVRQNGALQ